MKKVLLMIIAALSLSVALAQSPNSKINYQAVLHDSVGNAWGNHDVTLKFEILPSNSGSAVYEETQNRSTTEYGVINTSFGPLGSAGNGFGDLNSLNWESQGLRLKVTLQPSDVVLGTQSFTMVPYAFFAQKADTAKVLKNVNLSGAVTSNVLQFNGSSWVPASINAIDNQQLSISGNTIALTNGGSVPLPNEVDGDTTNEIQTLQLSAEGRSLAIKDANGNVVNSVDLSVLVPPGTIQAYGGATAPLGWALCDGSPKDATLNNNQYMGLYTAIGTAFGGTGQTNFYLPDLRGRFLRGVDTRTNNQNDPDNINRIASNPGGNLGALVGSYQDDSIKSHSHGITSQDNGSGGGGGKFLGIGGVGATTNSSGGSETRPKNVYVNYIIKL